MATESILDTIKQMLGLEPEYEAFDVDIMIGINTAFSTLTQVGVGPSGGFQIVDKSATWESYLGGRPDLNMVKSYVYIQAKLLFDPPATSFAQEALAKTAKEMEWRLQVATDPPLPPKTSKEVVL